MKSFKQFLVIFSFFLYAINLVANNNLEKTQTFFPEWQEIMQENIEWYFLEVPENWDNPGKNIKIAVIRLKSKENQSSNSTVFIEGGPGGSAIGGLWRWLGHPLRKESDIILLDMRGTGFSQPELCPGLGNSFLEIFARNDSPENDEKNKTELVIKCKDDLIKKGIDLSTYNSKSISKDLHALKEAFNYDEWNIYGVSYGTHIAMTYAYMFPDDIKSLVLDSSIPEISEYYNQNTSNYLHALNLVFDYCKKDPELNKKYPDLEEVYHSTIKKLEKKPITVNVSKKIISTGKFTFNSEDMKIAIHQALYQRRMIEILPLLITEFNKENKQTLSVLVSALSGALSLDYGAYYCITCNEVIPYNSLPEFYADAKKQNDIYEGLLFYKSDFTVCEKWTENLSKDDTNVSLNFEQFDKPVLIFAGEFDPITPSYNGELTAKKFKNSTLIKMLAYGHCPSISEEGSKIVSEFIKNPKTQINMDFNLQDKVHFITNTMVNGNIVKFAMSLNKMDYQRLTPLFLSLLIIVFITLYLIIQLIRKKKFENTENKLIRGLIITNSILNIAFYTSLIFAILNTASINYYLLAFGVSSDYKFIIVIQYLSIILSILSVFHFSVNQKKINQKKIILPAIIILIFLQIYFII